MQALQSHRQTEKESGAFAFSGLGPNAAPMPFYNFARNRKAHARALYFAAMQPLEEAKNTFGKFLAEAATVVSH